MKHNCGFCGHPVDGGSESAKRMGERWFCNERHLMLAYGHKPADPTLPMSERVAMWCTLAVIIVIIVLLFWTPTYGKNLNGQWDNSPNKALFAQFVDGNERSCCDGGDFHKVHSVADWEMRKDGHYWVRLFGQWIQIPDVAAKMHPRVPDDVTHGEAVIWYNIDHHEAPDGSPAGGITIYCFQPGLMSLNDVPPTTQAPV